MRTITIFAAGIIAAAVTSSAFAQGADQKFIKEAIEGNLAEVQMGQLALKNADSNTIKKAAVGRGMRTLRQDGGLKVLAGMTTIEEVMMVTAEDLE